MFCGFLRGNTAATIKLGPFLDSTDGNTDETALTISQADVRLSKNGGDMAQKNDSNAATHDEIGIYDCALNTTDTNTYGRLRVTVHESEALTVDQTYQVLPEIIYDSFFPSAAGAPLPIFGILDWGTAQASAAGTLVHRSGLNLADDIPNGATEFVYSGTGAGQSRVVHDFANASDTSSISPNWTTTPDNTSLYATLATPPASTGAPPPVQAASVRDAIGLASANLDTQLGAIDDYLDTEVAAIKAKTDNLPSDPADQSLIIAATDAITTAISNLNDLSAAEVNAEVDTAISDAALATASALATVDSNVDDLKSGIIYGAAATGTLSTTQATTNLTGYADDQLIGRVIIWLSGACEGEASRITDYANTGGLVTFEALTTAPGNGDLLKVV